MKNHIKIAMSFGLGLLLASIPAQSIAALQQGAKAPDFTLNAAQGGKPFSLSLKQTLRNGPVVLYFFPAAFTPGCTVEAHLFAEANSRFNQLGARVVGVTAGNIDRVAEFSRMPQQIRSRSRSGRQGRGEIRHHDARPGTDHALRPDVVRDRARRDDPAQLHRPQPARPYRKDDGGGSCVERQTRLENGGE